MPVIVPNLVGLGRLAAEAKLDALKLRHIAKFPFSATGDGSATAQDPAAGTQVPTFSIVSVSYPTTVGPLDDSPVQGPTLPASTYEGEINAVLVGDPWGSGAGAWIDFATKMDGGSVTFIGTLYRDSAVNPEPPLSRTEWMRRGGMLGAAQRAFTHRHRVRLVTMADAFIQSIQLVR
jgi:hypothetical protein